MASQPSLKKMAKRSKSRPKCIIDWNKVEQLIMGGSNGVQVAAEIGVYPDTLYRACEREKGATFAAYYQEKRAKGDLYLHQAQYHKAVKEKNTQMLIHLGEFRLGQVKGAQKQTQDLLEGLSGIVEDFRDAKAEREKDTQS